MNPQIEHRPYGQTGESVSIIGLGGACLSQHSPAEGIATVRRALELGVSYFDTSPFYGQGASQDILGQALQGRTERYLLATKIGRLPGYPDFRSPEALWAQLRNNLRLLRRDSTDTLQIHESDWACWWMDNPNPQQRTLTQRVPDIDEAPVMKVLRQAKRRGLCRFIGLTGNNAEVTAQVLEQVEVDTYLVAFNYDLICRTALGRAVPRAVEKKVALILGGIFQNGRLAQVRPELLSSPPKWMSCEFRDRLERLYDLQKKSGLSLVEMTIRFLITDQNVSTILVGASKPEEIEQSVAAAQAGPLPNELHQALDKLGLD